MKSIIIMVSVLLLTLVNIHLLMGGFVEKEIQSRGNRPVKTITGGVWELVSHQ